MSSLITRKSLYGQFKYKLINCSHYSDKFSCDSSYFLLILIEKKTTLYSIKVSFIYFLNILVSNYEYQLNFMSRNESISKGHIVFVKTILH